MAKDQARKGGYRHLTKEFMRRNSFGQFLYADSKNRCYTGEIGTTEPKGLPTKLHGQANMQTHQPHGNLK